VREARAALSHGSDIWRVEFAVSSRERARRRWCLYSRCSWRRECQYPLAKTVASPPGKVICQGSSFSDPGPGWNRFAAYGECNRVLGVGTIKRY
jgi:hypothetical protein